MPLTPVCAFDVPRSVQPTALTQVPDDPVPLSQRTAYRWLHFDLDAAEFGAWADRALPPIVAAALTQKETRPRCTPMEGGLALNLRGVNLNPGADPDDMV